MIKTFTLINIALLGLTCSSVLHAQTTYFVDGFNGNNANSGLKKTDAFQSISAAINYSSDGDIIRIMPGVYNEQVIVNKRLTLIGSGSSSDSATSTIIRRANGQVVTIDAGLMGSQSVSLQNLRVEATQNGSAITILCSNVSLERIAARGAQQRAIQINNSVENILIGHAELFGSHIGLLVNDDIDVQGLQIRNSLFENNHANAIMFRESGPQIAGKVENVLVSNCMFKDNNPTNVSQGHTIYIEKLSHAIFENISVYTPPNNSQNAIDLNLKWRTDYTDITFRNILISRATEGIGIFIKGRDDAPLHDAVPASVSNINITGSRFWGCRSNIRIENNVNGINIHRNDLSNFNTQQGFAIANLSTSFSPLNADHNYFGATPFLGLIYAASSTQGSNVLTLTPPFNSEQITPGLFVFGQYVPFATIVIEINGNDLILSNPVNATTVDEVFMFSPNMFPSAHIVAPAISPLSFSNPLEFLTVNNLNQSFSNLEMALLGTPDDGQIFHVQPIHYPGAINIDRHVFLHTAGAGSMDPSSVPQFDNLVVNTSGGLFLNMDITVVNQLLLHGNLYLNDQQLNLEGKIGGTGEIFANLRSSIYITGNDTVGVIRFNLEGQELGQFQYNRGGNGMLQFHSDVKINYAELLAGILYTGNHTLLINSPEIQKIGQDFLLIGRLGLQIASERSTFDLHFPIAGFNHGRRDFELSIRQSNAHPTFYYGTLVEQSGYDLNLDLPDGIDRISPIRYWLIEPGKDAAIEEAHATIYYTHGDLVKDTNPEHLKMLKQDHENDGMWMNIGGYADPPVHGKINSTLSFTELGLFSLGNVVGGLNMIPDTIYVDALFGNDQFNGLSPVFNPETLNGPKQTIQAGITAVDPTGIVSISGAYYPERVILNKRIGLTKSGVGPVSADTLVMMSGAGLLPVLPSETDFAFGMVDLGLGVKLADGFRLVAENGLIYLRNTSYPENLSTNKSFTIAGVSAVTVHTIHLNADNMLTFTAPIVVANQINLNPVSGSRIRIENENLVVENLSQITGISPISYVITDGSGYLTIQNLDTETVSFPVGTVEHYAPVVMRDDNQSGDAVGVRVRLNQQADDFLPALPETAISYVQLQWFITEANPGGHRLKLSFQYDNQVQVNGFDGQSNKVLARSIHDGDWIALNSAIFEPNSATILELSNIEGTYAMYAWATDGLNSAQFLPIKVFPNPFQTEFQITVEEPFEGMLQLTDIAGRICLEKHVKTKSGVPLNISAAKNLPQGVYFIHMNDGLRRRVYRLVKQS